MSDKLFVIAIGGTGMRCLEAFVHLCAAGLFDGQTIDILTLDTDETNGNKDRVERLISLYNQVKTNDNGTIGGQPRHNTFFSAKLNLYRFFTNYSSQGRMTLEALSQTRGLTDEQIQDNKDLSDLLFERDSVQQFKLDYGYRAQTHLGSMLMYHGIVESAVKVSRGGDDVKEQDKDLKNYLQLLNQNAANARVFVFGSVFGGTGASSIPVIPLAISEALRIITGGENIANLDKILFGSTLLTDYFHFDNPDESQMKDEKVVAKSNNFTLNSQAALNFYYNDPTVQKTYRRFYHIGCPNSMKANFSNKNSGKVQIGGHDQCNPAHVMELMCAAAAWDFFNLNRTELESKQTAEYVFRSVEENASGVVQLTGASFTGQKGNYFENKLGAFLSLAHIILSKYNGAKEGTSGTNNLLDYLDEVKLSDYNSLTTAQCEEIDKYLKEFGYSYLNSDVCFGWIYQVYASLNNATFLFNPEAFTTNIEELKDIDPGTLFIEPAHHWDKTGNILQSESTRHFNTFIKLMKQDNTLPTDEQAATLKEQFLAHLYNAITQAQHFEE